MLPDPLARQVTATCDNTHTPNGKPSVTVVNLLQETTYIYYVVLVNRITTISALLQASVINANLS